MTFKDYDDKRREILQDAKFDTAEDNFCRAVELDMYVIACNLNRIASCLERLKR